MTSVANEPWFRDRKLQAVLAILNRDGGEARVVGGAVRNSLMGIPVSDMDIATTLPPEEVARRVEAGGFKSVPTGLQHGTVTVVVEGVPFEVTTLRRDVATDGRHAEVEFTDDWRADAERRDLTINALYADAKGEVHDYVGGLPDIESSTIRFIGEASRRIEEDYLRILRFFRFFAYYGKGRPDPEGLKACAAARSKLGQLSAERVWSETRKLLSAADPFRALLWMRTAGVLTEILPETEKWGIDAIPSLIEAERRFGWTPEPMLRLAAIVPPDAGRLSAMAERLRMSGAERQTLMDYANYPQLNRDVSGPKLRALFYRHGVQGAVMRARLGIANLVGKGDDADNLSGMAAFNSILETALGWQKPQMPVKGGDLIAAGMPAGPKIGETLSRLEDQWIESDFRLGREELLAALAKLDKDQPG